MDDGPVFEALPPGVLDALKRRGQAEEARKALVSPEALARVREALRIGRIDDERRRAVDPGAEVGALGVCVRVADLEAQLKAFRKNESWARDAWARISAVVDGEGLPCATIAYRVEKLKKAVDERWSCEDAKAAELERVTRRAKEAIAERDRLQAALDDVANALEDVRASTAADLAAGIGRLHEVLAACKGGA